MGGRELKKKLLTLVFVLAMCLPFISVMSIGAAAADSKMTVYVTASYNDAALVATSHGSARNSVADMKMICVPVELTSSSATVKDALVALADKYYSSSYSSDSSISDYLDAKADYWGVATDNNLSFVASYIMVNGVEAAGGSLNGRIGDGDHIIADIGAYDSDWNPEMTPTCVADTDGAYLGYKELKTGTTLSFEAGYYAYNPSSYNFLSAKKLTSGCGVYVTNNLSSLGSELTASSDTYSYSYTFPTSGTYYIVVVDSSSDSPNYCASAERIVVKDPVTNTAPNRKSSISATATASTYVNKTYTLSLPDVFEDANDDGLTYTVSINGETAVTASATYNYTPTDIGTMTLVFSANDGTANSTDTYTVTLTATAAPASATALSALAAYFSTPANVLPFSSSDTTTQWAIADIMAYDPSLLSDEIKQAYVDYVIYQAPSTADAGTLARYIITLKALGYDATRIDTDGKGTYFDAVDNMIDRMNSQITSATRIYTLPYVLIALQQYGDKYSEQIDEIIGYILDDQLSAGGWNGYGAQIDADTTGPVLLALGQYYTAANYTAAGISEDHYDRIKTAVNKALALVSGLQGTGGAISSWGSENASSTGVMMAGLSALGESPDSSSYLCKSLTDGLMLLYNSTSRFGSGFYDEQGLRGLIAASKFSPSGYRIYDFSSNTSKPAVASAYYSNCLVTISVIPTDATIVVTDTDSNSTKTALTGTSYDLAAGNYSYSASCSGYTSKTVSFQVTSTEAAHSRKDISVSLSSAPSSSTNITVTVSVKIPDASDTNNSYTYKHNASNYTTIVSKTVTLSFGSSVFDALDAVLESAGISYTEGSSGYISAINGLKEFDHGPNSGWLYMVNGTIGGGCRKPDLKSNSTIIWFFTDDYTKDYGSESWSSGSNNSVVVSTSGNAMINPAMGGTVGLGTEALVAIPAGALSGTDKVEVAAQKLSSPPPAPTGFLLLGSVFEFSVGESTAYTFNQPVTLSFTFDLKELPSGQKPSVYYFNEKFMQWVDLGGTVSGNTISVNVTHFTKYALFAKEISAKIFTDVPADFWASNAINKLYSRGCISGYSDGSFKPDKSVTRAEFSTILAKALGLNTHGTTDKFADVTTDDWYYDAVNAAASANLVSGMGNSLFAPDTLITREQMAVMVAKALGDKVPSTDNSELNAFNDKSSVSSWAMSGMCKAIKAGIISGMTADTLAPQADATRAQAAEMIFKLLTIVGK
jgi:hypothetical protein